MVFFLKRSIINMCLMLINKIGEDRFFDFLEDEFIPVLEGKHHGLKVK